MTTKEGYKVECSGFMGDSEDLILNMQITFLNGKLVKEMRFSKANKKGIASTSMYGIKCKVNINTLEVIEK